MSNGSNVSGKIDEMSIGAAIGDCDEAAGEAVFGKDRHVRVGSVVAVVGQNSAQRGQALQVCHATLTAGGLGLGLTE